MAPDAPTTRWSPAQSSHYFRMFLSVVGLIAAVWMASSAGQDRSLRDVGVGMIGLIFGYWLR